MYQNILLQLVVSWFICSTIIDYWDDDFDETKNCQHQKLMDKLKKDPDRCIHTSQGSDESQWEVCKRRLGNHLASSCVYSKIDNVSKVHWRISQGGRGQLPPPPPSM